ncbi:thrombospondin type 3 repeat-containing protein, partial [Candidatus Woesearchaeota archaeon]|nr:thrombospondin type 3 repeat-containing protein [Candidatus Woesearchaeota archaeon]
AGSGDDSAIVNLLSAGNINYCVKKDQALRYKWIELYTFGSNNPQDSLERVKTRCVDEDVSCHTSRWQCDSRIPDALPSQGCRVLATDPGGVISSSGCADGFAESGSLIPGLFSTINSNAFTSGESISHAAGDPNAKNILTKNFRWANSIPLICAEDHLWHACNKLLEGKTIQLGNTFAGRIFAGPVKVQCVLEEGQYSFKEILDFDNDGVPEGEDSSLYKGQCRGGQKENCFDNCPANACVGKIMETSPNKYKSLTAADCANPSQDDTDSDGVGNSCDLCPDLAMSVVTGISAGKEVQRLGGKDGCPDGDLDGIIDTKDNCPPSACESKKVESVIVGQSKTLTAYDCDNPDQHDSDLDKIGDVCDPDLIPFAK